MATQMLQGSFVKVQARAQILGLQPEKRVRLVWEDEDAGKRGEYILLARVNVGFTEPFWLRFSALRQKLEAETLSEVEREEFLALNDELELRNADRMDAIATLAQRHEVSLPQMMERLGVDPFHIPERFCKPAAHWGQQVAMKTHEDL